MDDMPAQIREATARRDAALREAQRWEVFIEMWYELNGSLPENARNRADNTPADLLKPSEPRTQQQGAGRPSVRGDETNDLAAAIIAERGSMGTRQLLPLMAERGHTMPGKDPYSVLHTRLSRGKPLVFDKMVGWRLRETPQPRHEDEAAGATLAGVPAASPSTPNDAERRGEVAHD